MQSRWRRAGRPEHERGQREGVVGLLTAGGGRDERAGEWIGREIETLEEPW